MERTIYNRLYSFFSENNILHKKGFINIKKFQRVLEFFLTQVVFLNSKSLRSIPFALVHPYINYANIAWASTDRTYLKRILGKQKQAARLMSSHDNSIPLSLLMKKLNILNVYQINILQHLLFMFKVKNHLTPKVLNQLFSLINHLYPTRFSDNSFKTYDFNLKLTRFTIGFRGPTIWNKFFMKSEKCYTGIDVFKNKTKEKILNLSNEFLFF